MTVPAETSEADGLLVVIARLGLAIRQLEATNETQADLIDALTARVTELEAAADDHACHEHQPDDDGGKP